MNSVFLALLILCTLINISNTKADECNTDQNENVEAAVNISFDYNTDPIQKLHKESIESDRKSMESWNQKILGISQENQITIRDEIIVPNDKNETPKQIFLSHIKEEIKALKDKKIQLNYTGHGVLCLCDKNNNCTLADTNNPNEFHKNLEDQKKLVGEVTSRWCMSLPTNEQSHQNQDFKNFLVSDTEIREVIKNADSLFIDACYAGKACEINTKKENKKITIFASAMAAQTSPAFTNGGLLWHSLKKLSDDEDQQCKTDLNGDGDVSEEEAALYISVNTFKCDVSRISSEGENIQKILEKSLTVVNRNESNGDLSGKGVIPEYSLSNKCLFKIRNKNKCQNKLSNSLNSCKKVTSESKLLNEKIRDQLMSNDLLTSAEITSKSLTISSRNLTPKITNSCPETIAKKSLGVSARVEDESSKKSLGVVAREQSSDSRLKKIKSLWAGIFSHQNEKIKRSCSDKDLDCSEEVNKAVSDSVKLSNDIEKILDWISSRN